MPSEIHKIPATVLSRCQRHEFRRIPVKEIVQYLRDMCTQENFTISDDALISIARHSTGCMRDAISLLDQLTSSGGDIDINSVQAVLGTATSKVVIDLLTAIRTKAMGSGLTALHQAMDAGSDPRQLARQIVDYLRSLLLIKMGNPDQVDESADMVQQMQKDSAGFEISDLVRYVQLFNEAASGQGSSWQPGLSLELAFAQALLAEPQPQQQTDFVPQPLKKAPVKSKPAETPLAPPPAPQVTPKPQAPVMEEPQESDIPQAQEETAVDNSDSLSLGEVLQQWRQVRTTVKKVRPATEALLNSCKPISLKSNTLTLGFASEVLRSRMDQPENTDLTRQVLLHLFNKDVQIRCVVSKEKQNADDQIAAPEESMLKTVLDLGGKLVDPESHNGKEK